MGIEFDPDKRDATLRERGLDFRDAPIVIDGDSVTLTDDRFDYGEVRKVSFGWLDEQAVAVVWTQRRNVKRIISMRGMHEEEITDVALARPR